MLKLNGKNVTWAHEVKHLGNAITSTLSGENDCNVKRSRFIESVNVLLCHMEIIKVVYYVNCFKHIVVPSMDRNYGHVTHMDCKGV